MYITRSILFQHLHYRLILVMEILNIISSICSILSLLASLFIVQKLNKISIKGNKNIVAGNDIKAGR